MRRTWWFRPFATLLTLWLPLIIGEPSLLQPCPMHGAMVVAAEAAASATPEGHAGHAGHGSHGAHAQHGADGAHATHNGAGTAGHAGHGIATESAAGVPGGPTTGHESAPGHQHVCTCIGCCAGSPSAVPSFEGAVARVVVAAYEPADAPAAESWLPLPEPEYSHPYTTGPPRA